MPINSELLRFLGKPYNFHHSPRIDLISEEAVNCQRLVHLLYQTRYQVQLPIGMWSQEIYLDEAVIFRTVTNKEQLFEGDIGIFGPKDNSSFDPRRFHLAVFTGEAHDNDPLLIHATYYDSQVSIWKLSEFFHKPRYAELIRIKRLRPHLFNTQIMPVIYQ